MWRLTPQISRKPEWRGLCAIQAQRPRRGGLSDEFALL